MKIVKYVLTIITFGLIIISYHAQSQAASTIGESFNQPADNLVTGGQPTQAELKMLKAAGITKVINLRGPDEAISYDEKAEAEALGLSYISLPVAGAGDVTAAKAKALYELLQGDDRVFVHCASGNRVGALLAIGAHEINGQPVDEALAFGRAAGLSSLESKVTAVLAEQPQ